MSLDMGGAAVAEERLELLLETRDRPLCPLLAVAGRIGTTRIRGIWTRLAIACWQSGGLEHYTLASRSVPSATWAGSPRLVHHPRLSLSGGSRCRGRCARSLASSGQICPACNSPSITASWSPWGWSGCASKPLQHPAAASAGAEFPSRRCNGRSRSSCRPPWAAAFRKRLHRHRHPGGLGTKRTGSNVPAILYRLETPCCVTCSIQVMHARVRGA